MTDEYLRAFIGLPIKGRCADLIEALIPTITLPKNTALRLSPRSNWHVTLHFFGAKTERSRLDEAWQAVKATVQKSQHVCTAVQSLVGLPMHHSQAWVLTLEPTRELLDMQQKVCNKLSAMGFAVEERPYLPHITLWRPVSRQKIDLPERDVQLSAFKLKEVALYVSEQRPEGSAYRMLDQYSLI